MTKIKSYTDLDQSKILVEILSPESADLWWAERFEGHVELNGDYIVKDTPYYYLSFARPSYNNYSQDTVKDIPCWSFAALFDVLPDGTDVTKDKSDTENEKYMCTVGVKNDIISTFADNPVDACVEMILKLNELKML